MLTEIPPIICKLRNLQELQISNNRLKCLPAEIMKLKLTKLSVHPNPFIENPHKAESNGRWCDPTRRLFDITPLTELCLRVLLAPFTTGAQSLTIETHSETVLEALYGDKCFPLTSHYNISPEFQNIFGSCVPKSVPSTLSTATTPDKLRRRSSGCTTICECPSTRHLEISNNKAYSKPVFIGHTEERMTWEREIAGQKVDGDGVPVLWRGCSAGCLDFLGDSKSYQDEGMIDGGWEPAGMDVDGDNGGVKMLQVGGPTNPSRAGFTGMFSSEDIDLSD